MTRKKSKERKKKNNEESWTMITYRNTRKWFHEVATFHSINWISQPFTASSFIKQLVHTYYRNSLHKIKNQSLRISTSIVTKESAIVELEGNFLDENKIQQGTISLERSFFRRTQEKLQRFGFINLLSIPDLILPIKEIARDFYQNCA